MGELKTDLEGCIQEGIRKDGHLGGCHITVHCNGRTITLSGKVFKFYQKSLAQTVVMHLITVRNLPHQVENSIEVSPGSFLR